VARLARLFVIGPSEMGQVCPPGRGGGRSAVAIATHAASAPFQGRSVSMMWIAACGQLGGISRAWLPLALGVVSAHQGAKGGRIVEASQAAQSLVRAQYNLDVATSLFGRMCCCCHSRMGNSLDLDLCLWLVIIMGEMN